MTEAHRTPCARARRLSSAVFMLGCAGCAGLAPAPAAGQAVPATINLGGRSDATPGQPIYGDPFRQVNLDYSNVFYSDNLTGNIGLRGLAFDPRPFTLGRRGRVPDPTFSAGPFALDLTSLRFALLASDNVDQVNDGAKAGVIAVSQLGIEAQLTLGENFTAGVSGSLIMLPLEGEAGLEGFGLFDQTTAEVEAAPITSLNLVYKQEGGRFEFEAVELLSVRLRERTERYDLRVLAWDPVTFTEADTAGRYSFGNRGALGGEFEERGALEVENVRAISPNKVTRNLVGVTLGTPGPLSGRFRFSGYNQDQWREEIDGSKNHQRNYGGRVFYGAERENTRFKPFAYYKFDRTKGEPGWDRALVAGVRGPVSDQMDIAASRGTFWNRNGGRNRLYRFSLRHVAGPYTIHGVTLDNSVIAPGNNELERAEYRISQVLGRDLVGSYRYQKLKEERPETPLDNERRSTQHHVQLNWEVSDKLTLETNHVRLQSETGRTEEEGSRNQFIARWEMTDRTTLIADRSVVKRESDTVGTSNNLSTFRSFLLSLRHRVEPDWYVILSFRHTDSSSDLGSENYKENFILLEAIKEL